jgi:hypothetical protein
MRHLGAFGGKKQLQLLGTEFGSVGDFLDAAVAGQFGQDCDGHNQSQRIAEAARFAPIDEGVPGRRSYRHR